MHRVKHLPEELAKKEVSTAIAGNPKGIAELLKSAAHPARLKTLASLLQGQHEFSRLMHVTELSKTALANHIDQLIETGLVQRVERGEYVLTADGKKLLSAAASVYVDSQHRENEERALISERYSGLARETAYRRLISKPASFVPCWLSYVGSVAGALRALGVSCDAADVGGYSGYAFIVNVLKYGPCPSGPTSIAIWDDIFEATENLGFALEKYEDAITYSTGTTLTPEWIEATRALFERTKQEIAERDQPVVLWGLVTPEFGIVNGYEGDHYIASTIRSGRLRRVETPIAFSDLFIPARFLALFFRASTEKNQAGLDRQALERATRYSSGKFPTEAKYVAGPLALKTWAGHLLNLPEERLNYYGNAYVAACVSDARWLCGQFLGRLAQRHPGKQLKDLQLAADCYRKSRDLMQAFTRVFPFPPAGTYSSEDREKGATLLEKAGSVEEEVVEHMKDALRKW